MSKPKRHAVECTGYVHLSGPMGPGTVTRAVVECVRCREVQLLVPPGELRTVLHSYRYYPAASESEPCKPAKKPDEDGDEL